MKCQRCRGKGTLQPPSDRPDAENVGHAQVCPVCKGFGETGPWNHEQERKPKVKRKIESLPLPGSLNDPVWEKGRKE